MRNVGLLATEVAAKLLVRDGLLAEPKVLLGKLEAPETVSTFATMEIISESLLT